MEMESVLHSSTVVDLESVVCYMVVETALLTQKALLWLLFVINMGSRPNGNNVIPNLTETDQRFPLAELNRGEDPAAENMDAGETEDAKNKKRKAVDTNDGQSDDDSEEGSDDDDSEDFDGESSDEDDEDDEDEDDDDDEDEDDEDDDDEDDGEEGAKEEQRPTKRRK